MDKMPAEFFINTWKSPKSFHTFFSKLLAQTKFWQIPKQFDLYKNNRYTLYN